MDITPSNIDSLQVGFEVLYREGYESVTPWYKQLVEEKTSDTKKKRFALPSRLRSLRKWVGDRVVENLVRYTTDIETEKRELTVAVDVENVEDDQFDLYQPDMTALGVEVADFPNVLLVDFLRNGTSATLYPAYDGLAFWSASHLVNAKKGAAGGMYSNYRSAAFALTGPNFETIRAEMRARLADNGRPMRLGRKLLLVVPPQLEATGKRILQNDYVAAASGTATETNPNKGTAELVVVEDLAVDAATWYVIEVGWIIKPIAYVSRVKAKFTMLAQPTDQPVWSKDQIQFGVRQRDGLGPLLPQLAYKCVG